MTTRERETIVLQVEAGDMCLKVCAHCVLILTPAALEQLLTAFGCVYVCQYGEYACIYMYMNMRVTKHSQEMCA